MKNKLKIGGYNPDKTLSKWPMGSIFENEGQKLYDIVRKLKPYLIVEVGAFYGCSTTWIATALKHNKKGKLISIDNNIQGGSWSMVPESIKSYITFINDDAFLHKIPKNIDIVFEDGEHSPGFTKSIATLYRPKMAFISHDYMHQSEVGKNVKIDFDEMFGKPDEIYFEPPSDCGLAIKYF